MSIIYREQTAVYFKNHTKDLKMCGQNAKAFNVTYAVHKVTVGL